MGLFRRGKTERSSSSTDTAALRSRVWGRPGMCPSCQAPGYLDHIDMIDMIMYEHCPVCRHQWEERPGDLEA
jgi:hypothetical protein